jgi:hypothetical protein
MAAVDDMLTQLANFLIAENYIMMKREDYKKVCQTVIDKFEVLNDLLKRDIDARKTNGLLMRKPQTYVSLVYFQLIQFAQFICIL